MSDGATEMMLDERRENKARETLRLETLRANREHLELAFNLQMKGARIHGFVRNHRFADGRKWAFDFANPEIKIAIEIEGGTFSGGRHVRGRGYEADCEKYNQAAALGWTLFRFTSAMVKSGKAVAFLETYLKLSFSE